jgi:hypothetical protein
MRANTFEYDGTIWTREWNPAASSTLDSMSRLSAPCARVSLEAAKCREVPGMRPVAPKAVMQLPEFRNTRVYARVSLECHRRWLANCDSLRARAANRSTMSR